MAYFWVCANPERYYEGQRCRSLRTARRFAYRHMMAVGKGRAGGWCHIVKETHDTWDVEGTMHILKDRKVDWHSKFYWKQKKIIHRYVNPDGTLGEYVR